MATEGQAVLSLEGEILHTHQGFTTRIQENYKQDLRDGGVHIQGEQVIKEARKSLHLEFIFFSFLFFDLIFFFILRSSFVMLILSHCWTSAAT